MSRILIIRLSAIGDIVMASALIPALRRKWPYAYLAWLAESPGASLLEANPRLDEVIVWPRAQWRRLRAERRYPELWRSIHRFVRRLRERRYDLVLDLQGLAKSALWAWLSGAPQRIGLASRESSRGLMTRVLQPPRSDPRIGSEYRYLAEWLGVEASCFPMDLALTAADRQGVRQALARHALEGDYAVLCPFTTRLQKHWFDEFWRDLAEALAARFGLTSVLLGGPEARTRGERIAYQVGVPMMNLAGALTLRESAAAIAGARLLVGVDTGLTHIGTAVGIPTVALFGSTRPYLETDSPLTRVLYEALWCSPCRRRPVCGGAYSCMRLHRPAHVLAAARSLLEAAR
ncbi:MAG: glycosyltransferase family 9 protein [Nitrococcus mobilis]|nr:glycosyltransferase family 9 protein [Nitrococcus mobilis]